MQGNFSPLKAIINPPGVQSGMPGETLELHAVVMNQGDRSAIIDVFLDEAFQLLPRSPITPRERVALAAGQSTEVNFELEIPVDMLPGTYDYTLVLDAPQHYPQDTPIQYPRQIKVLIKEHTIVREHDPTFSLQPSSNPGNPLIFKPNEPLPIAITVENRSRRVDNFRLTCPDLEAEWFTIQYPKTGVEGSGLLAQGDGLELNPATVGQIFLTFHPPGDALAGSYILTLRLYSDNSPNLVLLDLIYIQIPPVYHLDLGLNTILGQIKRSSGQYQIKLANRGNTPRQVSFSARTQAEEELCTYQFNPIPVKLLPAKSAVVDLTVTPKHWWHRPFLGGGLAIDFHVDIEDQQKLPLSQTSIQGILVWQARPWWQFLCLLLVILGLVGGLGLIAWKVLQPQSVRLVEFKLENRQINEGDKVFLSWKIDDFKQTQKLTLTTEGLSPQQEEHSIEKLITTDDPSKEPRCLTENQSLICKNFPVGKLPPGDYSFKLEVFDRNNNPVDSKTTEKLKIVPKPQPETIAFNLSTPGKLKYSKGEPILLNWTVQLQNLAEMQIIAKSEDGLERMIDTIKLEQSKNCRQDQEKQQIVCTNYPVNISQAGKYYLQLKPISKLVLKSEKSPKTSAIQVKVEVLPQTLKIINCTINGSSNPTLVVREGETLTLNWQVDGEENITVELDPGGTVQRSGSKTIQGIQGLSRISLMATDNYGHKESRIFSIKVEPAVIPTPNQTPNPAPTKNVPPAKFPEDFKNW